MSDQSTILYFQNNVPIMEEDETHNTENGGRAYEQWESERYILYGV